MRLFVSMSTSSTRAVSLLFRLSAQGLSQNCGVNEAGLWPKAPRIRISVICEFLFMRADLHSPEGPWGHFAWAPGTVSIVLTSLYRVSQGPSSIAARG